jgi:hypothetical protein
MRVAPTLPKRRTRIDAPSLIVRASVAIGDGKWSVFSLATEGNTAISQAND